MRLSFCAIVGWDKHPLRPSSWWLAPVLRRLCRSTAGFVVRQVPSAFDSPDHLRGSQLLRICLRGWAKNGCESLIRRIIFWLTSFRWRFTSTNIFMFELTTISQLLFFWKQSQCCLDCHIVGVAEVTGVRGVEVLRFAARSTQDTRGNSPLGHQSGRECCFPGVPLKGSYFGEKKKQGAGSRWDMESCRGNRERYHSQTALIQNLLGVQKVCYLQARDNIFLGSNIYRGELQQPLPRETNMYGSTLRFK